MPKQNHFTGATLAEAVRNATGAYRRETAPEAKSFCSDLVSEYNRKRSELDQIQRDIGYLNDEIDDLQRDAARASLMSLALSLSVAASAARKWRGVINILRRFKLDKDALDAIIRNGPEAATAATALLSALYGIEDDGEAKKLAREVSDLQAKTDRIVEEMEGLAKSYLNGNCHLGNLQS